MDAASIHRTLTRAQRSGCLVGVYTNPDRPDRLNVGYVDDLTDTDVRIRSVTPNGDVVGFEIYPLSAILRVNEDDGNDDYLDKIRRIVGKRDDVFCSISGWGQQESGIRAALTESMAKVQIISVHRGTDEEEGLTGLVTSVAAETVRMLTVDQYGEDDEDAEIRIDEITSIDYATEHEQVRQYLRSSYASDDAVEDGSDQT